MNGVKKYRRWWLRLLAWGLLLGIAVAVVLGLGGSYPEAMIVVLAMLALVGGRLLLFLMVMRSKR
jgi:hypothetical protein